MRILHLTDLYAPVIGGLEHHVGVLSRALVARGHDVSIATARVGEEPPFENDGGVRVHRLRGLSQRLGIHEQRSHPFHPSFPDPAITAALRRVVASERPDVVHAHSWIVYSFLPLKRWSRAKLVLSMHSFNAICPKTTFVHRGGVCSGPSFPKCVRCATEQYGFAKSAGITTGLRLSRRLHDRVDRWVAVSDTVASAVAEHGRSAVEIDVVPVFYDEDSLEEAARTPRPRFLPPPDTEYLCFAGALGRHKGLDVLLDAYRMLPEPPPLVVMGMRRGDTPQFPDGVRVATDVPHPQVMAAFRGCAVAVVPSVWPEPFGTVAVEAMACGRPVVASGIGGLRDVVADGETGLLVAPGDPIALRDAVASLLADAQRRKRLGRAGRRRAAELYSASSVVPRLEAIYEGALGGARAPQRDGAEARGGGMAVR